MAQLLHRFWNVTFVFSDINDETQETTITVCEVDKHRAYTTGWIRAHGVCDDYDARLVGIKKVTCDTSREPRLLTIS